MDMDKLLEDFDDKIIERGKKYFKEGRVSDLEETAPGVFSATVDGSDYYEVNISIAADGESAEFDCDCPYDFAAYCKHCVAVLFAINERRASGTAPIVCKSDTKAVAPAALSHDLLDTLSKEELITLVLDIAGKFSETDTWLRAKLSTNGDDIKLYHKAMHRNFSARSYDDDYNSFFNSDGILAVPEDAIEHLNQLALTDEYEHFFKFAFMLIEDLLDMRDYSEDIYDELYQAIGSCMECVKGYYDSKLSHADKSTQAGILNAILDFIDATDFDAFDDFQEDLSGICADIATANPALRKTMYEYYLEQMERLKASDSYSFKYAQASYFALLKRWESKDTVNRFALAHTDDDSMCKYVYDEYIAKNNYDSALKLCTQCEQTFASNESIICEWLKNRFSIYEHFDDKTGMCQVAENLLLEHNEFEYYSRLKELYGDEWAVRREVILDKAMGLKFSDIYQSAIEYDEDKPRLMACVRKYHDLAFRLSHYLLPEYSGELEPILTEQLKLKGEQAYGRTQYQYVCKYIKLYASLMGNEKAQEIIEFFRTEYKRRRTFLEEMSNIELK